MNPTEETLDTMEHGIDSWSLMTTRDQTILGNTLNLIRDLRAEIARLKDEEHASDEYHEKIAQGSIQMGHERDKMEAENLLLRTENARLKAGIEQLRLSST